MSIYRSSPDNKAKHREIVKARRRNVLVPDADTIEHIQWCRYQKCVYCGLLADTHDHVVPISKGGINHWSNIVPSCRTCNSSKSDRGLIQWLLHQNRAT